MPFRLSRKSNDTAACTASSWINGLCAMDTNARPVQFRGQLVIEGKVGSWFDRDHGHIPAMFGQVLYELGYPLHTRQTEWWKVVGYDEGVAGISRLRFDQNSQINEAMS